MNNHIEFYKENHIRELTRKKEIDASIGFPTTLLTLLIGGGLFLFKDENFNSHMSDNEYVLMAITILTILFIISLVLAIIFLVRMYLNRFSKYKYLPSSLDLLNRENELYEHYLNHFEQVGSKKPKKKAMRYAKAEFQKDLLNYYVEFSTKNQLVNDGRLKDYYRSRKILIISIALIAIVGLLIILK